MEKENGFNNLLAGIIANAYAANPVEECDYKGEDGLLYCGKCNTPRETYITVTGLGKITVPIKCMCRQEAYSLEEIARQEKEALERISKIKQRSNMDPRYADCTFATVNVTNENRRQVKICKRYIEAFEDLSNKNQGLLFYGKAGTGKTHFACCIANELMEKQYSVYVTSMVKILEKASRFQSKTDEDSYIETMNRARLLIIDDLGAERFTDYGLELVYNVIDSRYRIGKPMIVTTNFSIEEMKNADDVRLVRIYDRIFELCYPVEFTGTSIRMKNAAKRFDEMKKLLEE